MDPTRHRRLVAFRRALPCFLGAVMLTVPHQGAAQTAAVYGGTVYARDTGSNRSRTFALDYVEPVSERFAIGFLYLNEGHLEGHHRDGFGAQAWLRTPPLVRGLRLAIGGGPYFHFDTATTNRPEYANRHGWGVVYGVAASMPLADRWSLELKLNRVVARDRFDTHVALLGIGYRLDARPGRDIAGAYGDGRRNREITLLAGQTIVNSFASERDTAVSLEYRHTVSPHVEWTATWLNEGEPKLISRKGLAAQAWLARSALDDRLRFGIGLGPYFALDRRHADLTGESERQFAGLVSLSARYRITPRWHARATWHRVLADYHRDTDVLLLGAGYSF
jgi:hypothetical protein